MLDLHMLEAASARIVVGALTDDVIARLGLDLKPCDIIMWSNRMAHIRKHIPDFKSEAVFNQCVESIPEIIADPDYVGIHPTKKSIEYIKRIDQLLLVAVRLTPEGELTLRTLFPLREAQLQDYIRKKTVVSCK